MPINFTDSPANGATITQGNSTFTYNSIKGVWNRTIEATSGLSEYATLSALPLVGVADDTLAKVLDTNKLYKWTGTGWYFLDPVNTNPTITTAGDAAYTLATDGTPTVVTLAANDPEGFPIIWSYAVTTGSLGSTATVSQVNNVFTITPSTLEANQGGFTITFTASDGVNIGTSTSAFTLAWQFNIDILTVSGGGGGGDRHGAGGGAGGYISTEALTIDLSKTYNFSVAIGAGGAGGNYDSGNAAGLIGGESSVTDTGNGISIAPYGGGGGGTYGGNPSGNFGSGGGGGGANRPGIAGTAGQGNAGGNGGDPSGGGGGGAGQVGAAASAGGKGGDGLQWFDGNYYAGGGGGGGAATSGGLGGGGNGAFDYGYTDGSPNTGGGGGGTRSSNVATIGANGGSGVVIFRVPSYVSSLISETGDPTITSEGGYTFYKYTGSGSFNIG